MQLCLVDDLRSSREQRTKQIEGFWRERDLATVSEELTRLRIKGEISESNSHCRHCRIFGISLGLYLNYRAIVREDVLSAPTHRDTRFSGTWESSVTSG